MLTMLLSFPQEEEEEEEEEEGSELLFVSIWFVIVKSI